MDSDAVSELPLITVITPTYNRGGFIIECLQSVIDQDYGKIEHIIVDDGSLDGTRELLQPYIDDGVIDYYYQENRGQGAARNFALSKARGEFICFLDSDNLWLPYKLSRQIEVFAERTDVDVIYGDKITINEHSEEINRNNIKRYSGYIAPRLIRDNFVSMNTVMARKLCFDELGGMNDKRRVADDYDLWLRFSARYNFLYLPEYFAKYRVMDDQISSDKTRRFDSNWQIISEFRQEFPDAMSKQDFDAGFAAFHLRKARYLANQGLRGGALAQMVKAVRLRPLDRSSWRGLGAILKK